MGPVSDYDGAPCVFAMTFLQIDCQINSDCLIWGRTIN